MHFSKVESRKAEWKLNSHFGSLRNVTQERKNLSGATMRWINRYYVLMDPIDPRISEIIDTVWTSDEFLLPLAWTGIYKVNFFDWEWSVKRPISRSRRVVSSIQISLRSGIRFYDRRSLRVDTNPPYTKCPFKKKKTLKATVIAIASTQFIRNKI